MPAPRLAPDIFSTKQSPGPSAPPCPFAREAGGKEMLAGRGGGLDHCSHEALGPPSWPPWLISPIWAAALGKSPRTAPD